MRSTSRRSTAKQSTATQKPLVCSPLASAALSIQSASPPRSELQPHEAAYLNNRAAALLMLNRFDAALTDAQHAFQLDPTGAKVQDTIFMMPRVVGLYLLIGCRV